MKVSKNFSLEELLVSSDHPQLAAIPVELGYVVAINLGRLVAIVLQPLRNRFGPIVIHSGYRPPALNAAVGGANHSTHTNGRGADISFGRMPAMDVWDRFKEGQVNCNFDRCAFYPDEGRFHIEVSDEGSRPRGLLYEANPTWVEIGEGT